VSNFLPSHIESIISDHRTSISPSINQIELHPLFPQQECVHFCREKGIAIQSYSSLGQGHDLLLQHPTILHIVRELNEARRGLCAEEDNEGVERIEPAHVCLRWALQLGFGVIPRSSRPDRIASNLLASRDDFIMLNEAQMAAISAIAAGDSQTKKFCWDLRNVV
jgi:diketogulonate reductase-like aldo/keto reductase